MQLRGCLYGTSTIQGHEKTSIEQDKLKIPPLQFYYKVQQPFFINGDGYLITKLQQYYKIRQVLL